MSTILALRILLFAGELLVGSAFIMALTKLAAVQKNASERHLAWVCASASLLVLPMLALFLPSAIRIVLPAPAQVPLAHLIDVAAVAPAPADPVQTGFSLDPRALAMALAALWLVGIGIIALRFAVSAGCLIVLKRRSRPYALAPEVLPKIVAARRECELRLSDRNDGPITWGIFRPIILLPKTAIFWPRERLHAVLLHELAHIRRRDSLAQILSCVVCACYWPNPLVWLGARAMRREAEMASDDAVIASGFRPSEYASALLELASEFRSRRRALTTIPLSMAAPSALRARVESVLSSTSLRSGVRSMDVVKITGLGLLATTAIALVCPSLAQEPPPPSTPAVVVAPDAPPTIPAPPAPEAPPASPAPPTPPAPPVPASDAGAASLPADSAPSDHRSMHVMVDGRDWNTLSPADRERIRATVRKATQEARAAVAKVGPQVEKAMREARISQEAAMRAVREARPQIEAAMAEVERARPQIDAAMEDVRKAQPEIDRALAEARPQIDAALAKVREELAKDHLDANIKVRVDDALKRAEIRIEAAEARVNERAQESESRSEERSDDTPDTPDSQ